MSQLLPEADPSVTSGNSPPEHKKNNPQSLSVNAAANVDASTNPFEKEKPKRTLGLKLFDIFLYPFLNNFVVFGISVAATYLTTRGGDKKPDGTLIYGKPGAWIHNRGELFITACKKYLGMGHKAADAAKMVTFSFVDGSIVALAVKLFENKREQIGSWIDNKLGTRPPDDRAYEAEPTQTWTSVGLGRLAAVAIVVPTAIVMHNKGLNDKWFYEPAQAWAKRHPNIIKRFGKWDGQEIVRVSLFEFVYTSICTAGLYFGSRLIARFLEDPEKKHKHDKHNQDTVSLADKFIVANDTKLSPTIHRESDKLGPDHKIGNAVRDGSLVGAQQSMQV